MQTLHSITGLSARIFEASGREPFMLAADLAEAYGTQTDRVTEQVRRNPDRFPDDFAFRLTEAELKVLKPQNAVSTKANRALPLVFTHAGALALSGVLKTPVAAEVSVIIHRAFAALEKRAMAETRFLLARLRTDATRARPITALAVAGTREGLSFHAIWAGTSYSREKLALELRLCEARGLIEALPAGTPALQPDLFTQQV
ncbi:MAG: hypothetical protein ABS35_19660 [Kaistia sp. SCN 65-12]|uniref:ORF6N domain-containing protein n=1 Tax=Bosea sp. (in: a-proteobacteria) TaxID=1871050 RepID=UPI000868BFA2|nr:ORF6N domain-containing protein [Bosea sp. (in: a-proteobacteria)]MBN9471688.1 ORF6N domain-containing protein [Bosea sp. (in: a-proteobacteria)]ODT20484.1 MAG: hypothetical protein ABS35_19660 [Kaistia sp. SCN 65-12]